MPSSRQSSRSHWRLVQSSLIQFRRQEILHLTKHCPATASHPHIPCQQSLHLRYVVTYTLMSITNRSQEIISTATREYFTPDLARRLNALATYTDSSSCSFSLYNLNLTLASWGAKGYGPSNLSESLCINNVPVTVWIVGEVIANNFYKDGQPRRKPGILVRPLLEEDFHKASRVLTDLSQPPVSTSNLITFLVYVQRTHSS